MFIELKKEIKKILYINRKLRKISNLIYVIICFDFYFCFIVVYRKFIFRLCVFLGFCIYIYKDFRDIYKNRV